MNDENDELDGEDSDVPESLADLISLTRDIENEAGSMAASSATLKKMLGSDPQSNAIGQILDMLVDTVMPILSSLSNGTVSLSNDLLDAIDQSVEESVLYPDDAKPIIEALSALLAVVAYYEANDSVEENKSRCSAAGRLGANALVKVKELMVEEDDDTGPSNGDPVN